MLRMKHKRVETKSAQAQAYYCPFWKACSKLYWHVQLQIMFWNNKPDHNHWKKVITSALSPNLVCTSQLITVLRFSIAVLELRCFSCFPLTLRCTFVVSAHVTELMFHSAHVEARTLLQHGILTTLNFLQAVGNSVALSNLTFAAFFVVKKESLSLRWSHILPFIVSRKWKYVIRSSHLKLAVFELSRQHVDFSHTKREIVRRVVHLEV